MQFVFTTDNFTLTTNSKQLIETKINKLNKYHRIQQEDIVHVRVARYKNNIIEINIFIDLQNVHATILKIQEKSSSFIQAVDVAEKKLERQLRKIKAKTVTARTKLKIK